MRQSDFQRHKIKWELLNKKLTFMDWVLARVHEEHPEWESSDAVMDFRNQRDELEMHVELIQTVLIREGWY